MLRQVLYRVLSSPKCRRTLLYAGWRPTLLEKERQDIDDVENCRAGEFGSAVLKSLTVPGGHLSWPQRIYSCEILSNDSSTINCENMNKLIKVILTMFQQVSEDLYSCGKLSKAFKFSNWMSLVTLKCSKYSKISCDHHLLQNILSWLRQSIEICHLKVILNFWNREKIETHSIYKL